MKPGLRHFGWLLAAGLLLALAPPASALEYRSTARIALLYDAPSTSAGKVAIAGSGLPLEVVVDTDAWVKVRDHSGRLAWIEKSALGGTRSVMVKTDTSVAGNSRAPMPMSCSMPHAASCSTSTAKRTLSAGCR